MTKYLFIICRIAFVYGVITRFNFFIVFSNFIRFQLKDFTLYFIQDFMQMLINRF